MTHYNKYELQIIKMALNRMDTKHPWVQSALEKTERIMCDVTTIENN